MLRSEHLAPTRLSTFRASGPGACGEVGQLARGHCVQLAEAVRPAAIATVGEGDLEQLADVRVGRFELAQLEGRGSLGELASKLGSPHVEAFRFSLLPGGGLRHRRSSLSRAVFAAA